MGWRRFIVYNLSGQRFHGCGFGPDSEKIRVDLFGSSGDYAGSGMDGCELYIHGDAQDQLAQIINWSGLGLILVFWIRVAWFKVVLTGAATAALAAIFPHEPMIAFAAGVNLILEFDDEPRSGTIRRAVSTNSRPRPRPSI